MSSIFDGLGEAPIFGRGNYMNPGSYDVQIQRVFPLDTRASGLATIAELDIKSATYRPQEDPQGKGRTWQPTPANTQGTWFQSMQDKNVALPALKQFLIACLGLRDGDPRLEQWLGYIPGSEQWPGNRTGRPIAILTNLAEWVTSDQNIFRGMFVHLDCTMIKTRRGEDFTRYDFHPLDFASLGLQPPNLDAILAQAMTPAPKVIPTQAQNWGPGSAGGGPPQNFQGYGQPPQAPPQGPGWGPSSASWGQPAPQNQPQNGPPPGWAGSQPPQNWGQANPQGWGQPAPQNQPPQAPPQNGPPPGWGQPAPQNQPSQNWGPPQGWNPQR